MKSIVRDSAAGFTELRLRGLPKRDPFVRYFLRKDTFLSNAILFTKFDLDYMSKEINELLFTN
jgi:hypothetical protein